MYENWREDFRLEDFIQRIDDPRGPAILRHYRDYADLYHAAPGSSRNHQTWEGGLADHLADGFRLLAVEYALLETVTARRGEQLPFTLAQAQIVWLFHDAEKVVVYGSPNDPRCAPFFTDEALLSPAAFKAFKENIKWAAISGWEALYGFDLTDEELNAIRYVHGEGDDYRPDRRMQSPLSAFVGNADRTSARILFASGQGLG